MQLPYEPSELAQMPIEALYLIYKVMRLETPNKEEQRKIEHGIKHKFHIRTYINQRYQDKWKNETMIINGQKLTYDQFYDEIDERQATMLKAILEYIEQPSIHKGSKDL